MKTDTAKELTMPMNPNLKLYVWEGVLVDYTSGIMFALATSVGEARKLILNESDTFTVKRDLKKEPAVYTTKVGFYLWGGS